MNKLFQIKSFLKYLFKAKTKHGVHSPFVFELITNVFPSKIKPDFLRIEFLRSQLLKDKSVIEIIDRGAGSKHKSKYTSISNIAKYSSVYPKRGALYNQLVNHFKPSNILELGTSLGFSTMYMATANPYANLTTIEGCNKTAELAQHNFNKLDLNNIHLIHGDFDIVLPDILKSNTQFDFVLIDGNHRKEPVLNYFNLIKPFLNSKAVLIFDDIHWSADMNDAWELIKKDNQVTCTIDLFYVGIVFFKPELTKQNFILRY